ncbi:MAG: lipopolysaccharide heptosyltransferase II [Gemmatimonadota bacterium]
MPPDQPPLRILAVRFSSIGDILLTTPLLRTLRHRHPAAEIVALTKRIYAPLLSDNPHLSRLLVLEPGASLAGLAATMRAGRFTHILDLHGNLRTAALRLLAPGPWRGYSKHRLARAILIRTKRNTYADSLPVAERYFEAAAGLDVHPDGGPPELHLAPAAGSMADRWLLEKGLHPGEPLVALAPGAAHATKRWPAPEWAALARQLSASGMRPVLVGGPGDVALASTIASQSGIGIVNAAGAFDLQGTGALIRRTQGLVSGDTGVMHMATAVGTPVVALFGPTVKEFGFLPYNGKSWVVQRDLDCRPCSAMGSERCPLGHHHCMRQITVEAVAGAFEGLIR